MRIRESKLNNLTMWQIPPKPKENYKLMVCKNCHHRESKHEFGECSYFNEGTGYCGCTEFIPVEKK